MSIHDLDNRIWAEALELLNRADRLHRQFFKPTAIGTQRPVWEPPVDVYESPHEFTIMVALPGVPPEQLGIVLENHHLLIQGQRRLPNNEQTHIHRIEIPYGHFERRIELPAGQFELDSHELVNGCLVISLRKI